MEDTLKRQLVDKQALLDQFEEDAAKKEVDVANTNLQERSQGEGMEQSELDNLSKVSNDNFYYLVITMATEIRQKQPGAVTQQFTWYALIRKFNYVIM